MTWIWLFVLASTAYHAWCLKSGRLRFTFSDGVTRRSGWLYRQDNPPLYWVAWVGGAGTTAAFVVYSLAAS